MDKYKFRAWDKENKQWLRDSFLLCVYGGRNNSIEIATESCGTEHGQRDCDIELMQFTGLKDCNKKEIYEGDFVKGINRINEAEIPQKVTFHNGCFMFGNWNAHEYFNKHQFIEIIGNGFENPHLLAKEES